MESLALWLLGAGLLLVLVSIVAVVSANMAASRDDKILDRTKTFGQVFRKSGTKNGD